MENSTPWHKLTSGDQVEIITSNKQKPKKLVKICCYSGLKSKIKSSLKEEKKKKKIGKEIAERKLRHLKVKIDRKTKLS